MLPSARRLLTLVGFLILIVGCDVGASQVQCASSTCEDAEPAFKTSAPDHRLPPGAGYITGDRFDIQPGDVVCITPGERSSLIFQGIQGTPENPITITNCAGGTATIRGGPYGISLRNSRHLLISGRSPADGRYNFVVDGAGEATVGVSVDQFSRDVEMAFVEVKNTTFAGIIAKTDDANENLSSGEDPFVLTNLDLHDLYVHDVGGEGMYLGSTKPGGAQHSLDKLRVYDNIIVRSGREGIQVGNAKANARVRDNLVYKSGTANIRFQTNGLQVSANTAGTYRDNLIIGTKGWGVIVFGNGNIMIENNFIGRSKGIFIDDRPGTISDEPIHIRRNKFRNISTPFVRTLNEKNRILVEENQWDRSTNTVVAGEGVEVDVSSNVVEDPPPLQCLANAGRLDLPSYFADELKGELGLANCDGRQ